MKVRLHPSRSRKGSLLIEVSLALGLTVMLALELMRASMLALSGNQWSIMQTLTDAYLTRETALANRMAFADVTSANSVWPDLTEVDTLEGETVTLGKLPGGVPVTAHLKRCRTAEVMQNNDLPMTIWKLHSVLTYNIGEKEYTKSRSILRVQ